jgi:hypothetical protein
MFVVAGIVVFVVSLLWFLVLLPRRGGKNAPPMVLWSPVVPIPFVGVIAEFFLSPNTMVIRCLKDYGPVFTIPVRIVHT